MLRFFFKSGSTARIALSCGQEKFDNEDCVTRDTRRQTHVREEETHVCRSSSVVSSF